MSIPVKKISSGFSMPVYGLGTWEMGGRWEADTSRDSQEIKAIQKAIELGITHIDTAESYGAGHAEELIGEAIKGYARQKLFIASKVSGNHQSYDDLLRSFEASIKRLQTDYLDLYLLHRYPDKGTDIVDTMRAMDRLIAEGLVKNIGVCNMTVNRFKDTQKHTANKLVCNQLHYSLDCREVVEKGVLQYSQENDVLVTAWGPLKKGGLKPAEILTKLAEKYGKTAYQIALNWLITQDNVITIPKTSNIQHLEENLGALGWMLENDDMNLLTQEFPDQVVESDRVPLNYEANLPA